MTSSGNIRAPSRRDPVAARIIRDWRRLAGGTRARDADRRTLVACSGGADSTALLLALSAVRPAPVVAHVVHDLRPSAETEADREAVEVLAGALSLEIRCERVSVADELGNREAAARRLRYAALRRIAAAEGLEYVATAHHADDQLETVLMRLIRGAGPAGLAGIRERRPLGGATLVRPMLRVRRAEAQALCLACGVEWREDATNRDTSRLRAALRARVLPELHAIAPALSARLGPTTAHLAEAGALVEARAGELARDCGPEGGPCRLERDRLRAEPRVVVGEVLRICAARVAGTARRDRMSWTTLTRVAGAIADERGGSRRFEVGPIVVLIKASEVIIERRSIG